MMKLKLIVALMIALFPGFAIAGNASSVMASILVELNHFPSAAHTETLTKIVASGASADEKMLAQIISRIAHQPGAEDKVELKRILESKEASDAVKTIAKAILNMNHRPQSEDIQALKGLIP